MTPPDDQNHLVEIDTAQPIWDRFFMVAPLVLIGTMEPDGSLDLAPKHMVTPMGWQNYFGFVCSPRHSTCSNIRHNGEFTVSFPKPSQVIFSSLAASPRQATGDKPGTAPANVSRACFASGLSVAKSTPFFDRPIWPGMNKVLP